MLLEFFTMLPLVVCIFWILFILLSNSYNRTHFFIILTYLEVFFVLAFFVLYLTQQFTLIYYLDVLFIASVLTLYPLLYVYIMLLTNDKRWSETLKKALVAPMILSVITILTSYIMPKGQFVEFLKNILELEGLVHTLSVSGKVRYALFYVNLAFLYGQIVYFSYKIIAKLKKVGTDIGNFYSNPEEKLPISANILYPIIILSSLLNIYVPYKLLTSTLSSLPLMLIVLISIAYSLLLFFLGLSSLKEVIFREPLFDETEEGLNMKSNHSDIIEDGGSHPLREDLLKLFHTKEIYKDPNLKITDIAYLLNTNRTYVSNLINNEMGNNFSDFVNRFRVNYAMEVLENPANETLSLVKISEQAGFANNNSFYRAFKKFVKTSPNQYRQDKLYKTYIK